jgi:YHS domain-containing protein
LLREEKMTHIDPVCAMEIEEKTASQKLNYAGRTYYFCGKECKEEFEGNPEDYAYEYEIEEVE